MKTITINGERYTISPRSYDALLSIKGRGIDTTLPDGVTLDSDDLREQCVAAVKRWRENTRKAAEIVRRRVEAGTAGVRVLK